MSIKNGNNEKIPLNVCNQLNHEQHHLDSIAALPPHASESSCERRDITFKYIFRILGENIAKYPKLYFFISLLISSLSFGMYFMILKDQIRDGYTPTNAPSRYETDVMRNFWNSSGDPLVTFILLTARDNGSMLRLKHLEEVVKLHNYLLHNFTLEYEKENFKFDDFCFPYCNINYVLNIFLQGLQMQIDLLKAGKPLNNETILSFPVSYVNGFKIHLEKSLFGVIKTETTPNNEGKLEGRMPDGNELIEDNQNIYHYVTDIEYVKVIMMMFRGDRTNQRKGEILSKWETSVYNFSLLQYSNPLIEMQVFGAEILDYEMMKDGLRLAPFFAFGFGLMVLFVVFSVNGTAFLYRKFDAGKILISFGATISSLLAVSTTYGLLSLLGFRLNSISLVLPFLVCGIGVDDAFLMIHSWQKLSSLDISIHRRMGLVYEEVGPSITITSVTNVISFGIGTFLPTPEISRFCMTTAMAIGMDYIFELILFGPMLVFATNFEKPKSDFDNTISAKGWREKVIKKADVLLRKYCTLISNRMISIFLLFGFLVFWYFAFSGVLSIETRLDSEKILPPDCPMQKSNKIINEYIWAEYHPVTVIINNPLDITNPQKLERFWNLVDEFESLERCKGNISTLLWLRDYEIYFKNGDMMDAFFGSLGFNGGNNKEISNNNSSTGLDFSKLEPFLRSPFSEHWNAFLKVGHTKSQKYVTSFWFTVAYQNTSTWDARIELMKKWREIASQYDDMNITVWEENAMFVDQMLSLKTAAVTTGSLTLACMAIVCAIFIPNVCAVITATIAIASISIGVLGFYSYLSLDLDPVTMAAILMSIGLSVDFIAHVAYHYQLTYRKIIKDGKITKVPLKNTQERLVNTFENIAWPMCQAAFSTIVCILPLVFFRSYPPVVFVKTIFLVVGWGTLHGLLLFPAFLAALPECLTFSRCCRRSRRCFCCCAGSKSSSSTDNIKKHKNAIDN